MIENTSTIESLNLEIVRFINQDLYLGALHNKCINNNVCFDCELWNCGYACESSDSTREQIIYPIRDTMNEILDSAVSILVVYINNPCNKNFAFKSQIERLLILLNDLQNKINSIQCVDTCADISLISHLLYTIVITMNKIISIMECFNGLVTYQNICGCMGMNFFDIMMGEFINEITCLQNIMQEWSNIVIAYFHYSSMATKSYVASYVPPRPVVPPTPNQNPMQHACVPCPPKIQDCAKTNICTTFSHC